MTASNSSEMFRQAAEAERGDPISAGARVIHAQTAVNSGRAYYVDLTGVPETDRPTIITAIQELVNRARTKPQPKAVSQP